MRRPARVKPFFWVVLFVPPTADQREAQLLFSLSFLERFLGSAKEGFDVIVIGSGLGGLSCAAAFARQNFRPL
jgi:hypothetical protein